MVTSFLQHSPYIVNYVTSNVNGMTALHTAAGANQLAVAKVIIQQVSASHDFNKGEVASF